ncbi:hypothetical protein CLV98_1571 [Dyadobacter jejuensis]|uniref:Uncharacterized protein n=1 Tax=Dyadobacter jejuensis TaxID=1082580 RepID=A0A315ZRF0_9BACT|nr:hypothetical protein [Dyadobacter jejuensis]PWJ48121.1 hypothetical protein CLV98_1571 [Dyadobacter jejuensis]
MNKKTFKKLGKQDQEAIKELVREQPQALLGKRREDRKGYSDLPLWGSVEQTNLF